MLQPQTNSCSERPADRDRCDHIVPVAVPVGPAFQAGLRGHPERVALRIPTADGYPYDSRLMRSAGTPSSRNCATTLSRKRGAGVVPACFAATMSQWEMPGPQTYT